MRNYELEQLINNKLKSTGQVILDSVPNGLQVEGRSTIQRIVTGVTASQALLEAALKEQADAIIVHHGYFWKNESPVIHGMKYRRIKTLLLNDINLYAWHLPLDTNLELGNNVQLAITLDINLTGWLDVLVPHGELTLPISGKALQQRMEQTLGSRVLHCSSHNAPSKITRIAWCTGGGQRFIELAADYGMDAFITGEVSEQTIHIARERDLHFYAAGHHATERGGIKALGEWLAKQYDLEVIFLDIPNPA